ncbi:MAG: hypothetical protein FD189_1126 [Elusimicrobia bacterium]|nr:MAG: hypothetical protein FD189_1126 [Elusimicrobiota bacterium]
MNPEPRTLETGTGGRADSWLLLSKRTCLKAGRPLRGFLRKTARAAQRGGMGAKALTRSSTTDSWLGSSGAPAPTGAPFLSRILPAGVLAVKMFLPPISMAQGCAFVYGQSRVEFGPHQGGLAMTESAVFVYVSLPEAVGLAGMPKKLASLCHVTLRTLYKWTERQLAISPARTPKVEAALEALGNHAPRVLLAVARVLKASGEAQEVGTVTPARAIEIRRHVALAEFALEVLARAAEREAGLRK